MSNEYDESQELEKILKPIGKSMEGLSKADLREIANRVKERGRELRFQKESTEIIEELLKDREPHREPRVIDVELGVDEEGEKIWAHIVGRGMQEILQAYDRRPLSVAHDIVAELMRVGPPMHIREDHPAIHLYPRYCDEVCFHNTSSFNLNVQIHADSKFKLPEVFQNSLFAFLMPRN